MKKISILILSCLMVSCATSQDANQSQNKEKNVKDMPTMLVGKQERSALTQAPFNSWFEKNYDSYEIDAAALKTLKPLMKGVEVKIFMGTWCGDSKRETPLFFKIMDAAGVKEKQLTLITMNRSKKTPDNLEEGLNITNVPTFIFYKDGKEINRIVEYPIESLEKDMIAILSGEPYKHAYAE
ncbi:thioredoxin family protein [Flavobacteriaceae bacterium M23B6Z8]